MNEYDMFVINRSSSLPNQSNLCSEKYNNDIRKINIFANLITHLFHDKTCIERVYDWNHFYCRLTLIQACISNRTPSNIRYEIIYLFSIFNGYIVEVWELRSNFMSHYIMALTHSVLPIGITVVYDIHTSLCEVF